MVISKGTLPGGHWATHRDAEAPRADGPPQALSEEYPDNKYTFDKLSGVFLTGNATRDDAPSRIHQQRVPREVAEGWTWMCPAGVYEIPEDAPEEGIIDLIVNPSNCVQCGAITAKGGRLTRPRAATAGLPDHVRPLDYRHAACRQPRTPRSSRKARR